MKRILLTSLLAFATILNLFAQENTLLWKVSGKDLKQDSYILGTIHIMCAEDFSIPENVKKTIANVDQIVYEADIHNPETAAAMQQKAMIADPTFFDDFDPVKLKLIDSVLTANQMSIKMFDMMSPTTVMSLLTLKSFTCSQPMNVKMLEAEIAALAPEKKSDYLESIDFQMSILEKIATPAYFYSYLNNYDEALALTKQMVNAYNANDLNTLQTILQDPKWMSEEVQKALLTDRNLNWVEILPAKIKESKTLIAVGAGHLIGDKGLIQLLRDKGYTVTPIH